MSRVAPQGSVRLLLHVTVVETGLKLRVTHKRRCTSSAARRHRSPRAGLEGLSHLAGLGPRECTRPALLICFHFLRSDAENLHNEPWRVRGSPLLTVLAEEEAQAGVIRGERSGRRERTGAGGPRGVAMARAAHWACLLSAARPINGVFHFSHRNYL